MSWKEELSVFSFIFKSDFLCLTMFFLNNLVSTKQFLTKMGNEIANPMPIKYKIFLGKGALPFAIPTRGPAPGPMRTPRSQTVLPTIQMEWRPCISMRKWGGGAGGLRPFPHFYDSRGKWARGNLQLVEAWNRWWKWYKLRIHHEIMWILPSKRVFLDFFNTKTREPRFHNGILDENSTNWQLSAKLHLNFTPILPSKTGFLGLLKC